MFKSGEISHKVNDILLFVALVISLALVLENRLLLPQAPGMGNTYPPPVTDLNFLTASQPTKINLLRVCLSPLMFQDGRFLQRRFL